MAGAKDAKGRVGRMKTWTAIFTLCVLILMAISLISLLNRGDSSPESFEMKDVSVNEEIANVGGQEKPAESTLSRKKIFEIGVYELKGDGDFSFIDSDGLSTSYITGELMLPKAFLADEFPSRTIVSGITKVEFSDPVDVTANIPEWNGDEPVARQCLFETRKPSVDYSQSFTGKAISIKSAINPVEVVSCSEGKFKLYRKASYSVNYVSYSPVLIKEVKFNAESTPGKEEKATAVIENVRGGKVDGELVLSDRKGVLYEQAISLADGQAELSVDLPFKPSEEGINEYVVEFLQGGELGEVKASYDFSVKVSTISISLETPEKVVDNAEVTVTLDNKLAKPLDVIIESTIIKRDGVNSEKTEKTLEPGINTVKFRYEGLKREDTSYDIIVTANYGTGKVSSSATLTMAQ